MIWRVLRLFGITQPAHCGRPSPWTPGEGCILGHRHARREHLDIRGYTWGRRHE